MNDQQFDRVTLSLRKSWSRQGTRELREYVLGLQAQRDLLVQAVALLADPDRGYAQGWYPSQAAKIEAFLAGIDAKVAAHQAQGTGAMPQPVVTAKFDTNSQAHVYKFGTCWNVACKDGNHSSNWATKEAAENWARENGYGIVSK